MKITIPILTFLILTTFQNVFGHTNNSDTVFIRKDSIKGFSQSIFIETNKNSKYYNDITSFTFGVFDKESYDNSLEYIKTNKLKLQKQKTVLPALNWITLKQYKGQFYAYYPCDFYTYFQASINDTTFIVWTGVGPVANQIASQKKINKMVYELKLNGIYDKDRIIRINIIDETKGIAVFTETTPNGKTYYLMIMANKIKTVPFIVNNCETQKQIELDFEEPNYAKLLTK